MSVREYQAWRAYRMKRGTLNTGLAVEQTMAVIATMYANAHSKSGHYKPGDFMPHFDEAPLTLERAMEEWF